MTRASAGTRVNSSGLVETVELLGSEDVTNGDFDTTVPLGDVGSGWTAEDGTAVYYNGGCKISRVTGASRLRARQLNGGSNILSLNTNHILTYEVLGSTNNPTLKIYAAGYTENIDTAIGVHSVYFTSGNANQIFQLQNQTNSSDITLDNISVKESTKNDLARVDYTGSTSSLLAEPQRTNLITYSEDFTDSSWTKLGGGTGTTAVVTSNYAISPDGTQNATRLVCDLNGGTTTSDQSLIYDLDSSNTSQSISIYMKSNTGSNQNIYFANTYGTGDTAIVTSEWQRFEFNHSTSNHTFSLGLRGNTGADNTADILIWAAQSEEGSYATSIIPTNGSTVTRVQDQYSKTGISDKIGAEGVLFIEMTALSNDLTNRVISLNDGTSSNRLMLYFNSSSNTISVAGIGGTIIYTVSDETSFNKMAVRYKTNDITLWVDGESRGTPITSVTIPTFTALKSNSGSGSSTFYGKVKQLQIYDTYLSNGDMQILTT